MPTTLADLSNARDKLGKSADRVDVAFVTVDPDRDTPEILNSYLSHFGFGVSGHAIRSQDTSELKNVEQIVHASSSVTKDPDGTVQVAHTAWTYVIDSNGLVVAEWPFGTSSKDMTSDMRLLLKKT